MNPPKNLNGKLIGAFVGLLGVITCLIAFFNLSARQGNGVLTRPGGALSSDAGGGVSKLEPPPVVLAPAAVKPPTHSPPSFSAKVVGVGVDGLTVVSTRDKAETSILLWGIDAPGANEEYGKKAHDFLNGLVATRIVNVQPVNAAGGGNSHVTAKVYVDGHLVNEQMVRAGLAKSTVRGSDVFRDAEAEATALRRGVWGDPKAMVNMNWHTNTSGGALPTFTTAATPSHTTVGRGEPITVKVNVTATGGPITDGLIDIEIYTASGQKLDQQFTTDQNFDPKQSRTYSYDWTFTEPGTYSVRIGVFNHTWLKLYDWHPNACMFTVK
jgi:endonuclease YncB( thermonuclease family)